MSAAQEGGSPGQCAYLAEEEGVMGPALCMGAASRPVSITLNVSLNRDWIVLGRQL